MGESCQEPLALAESALCEYRVFVGGSVLAIKVCQVMVGLGSLAEPLVWQFDSGQRLTSAWRTRWITTLCPDFCSLAVDRGLWTEGLASPCCSSTSASSRIERVKLLSCCCATAVSTASSSVTGGMFLMDVIVVDWCLNDRTVEVERLRHVKCEVEAHNRAWENGCPKLKLSWPSK